jgi:fucose permease
VSLPLPLRAGARAAGAGRATAGIPARFWVFAGFAVLYGISETMNGNWAQLDMIRQVGATTTQAALALTTFWAMVTAGRLLFALVQRWLPVRDTYRLLPFVLAVALVVVALLPRGTPALGVLAFELAGLGCSALLPLTISFGQEELVAMSASVAGGVIAFYQLGYGIAAFGAGPLQDADVGLQVIFGWTTVAAVVMGGLSFLLTARQPRAASTRA